MDLIDALRGTGAVREFEDRPVERAVMAKVLDTARFAPNGGNQQSWHVVLVEDPATKAAMRDLYVPGWLEYLEMRKAGVQPWAPIGDPEAEAAAIAKAHELTGDDATAAAGGFAAHFDQVPVMVVVLADLRLLAATDRDLGRYTLVGGASVYPFVWSILLAAHAEGLCGVVTTMTTTREPEVRELLRVPDEFALAAVLALGHPIKRPRNLRRDPVESFATVDAFDGPRVVGP
jgi:nitroreductase